MIRVNQAGEQGAVVISQGQQYMLPRDAAIEEILSQERDHLRDFTRVARERRIRPTVMTPVWHVAGYGLGMVSAALGRATAMVVHEAVEDVIADHYNEQLRVIHEMAREITRDEMEKDIDNGKDEQDALRESFEKQKVFEKELRTLIAKCRDEEMHHKEIAVENDSQRAPMYNVLYHGISTGCKTAIWISKRF